MREERKDQLIKAITVIVASMVILLGSLSINESRRNLDRIEGLQEQVRQQQENEE